MCSLGIEPTTFALLTQCSNHWATGTPISPPPRFWDVVWHGAAHSLMHARTRVFMHRCTAYCHPCFACTSSRQHVNECPWCLSMSAAPESQTFDCDTKTAAVQLSLCMKWMPMDLWSFTEISPYVNVTWIDCVVGCRLVDNPISTTHQISQHLLK